MLRYDESFTATMVATQHEATRLGATQYGSEHVLLGLLVAGGEVSRDVVQAYPALTADAVRAAVDEAADDLPRLERLGMSRQDVQRAVGGSRPAGTRPPRTRHSPELQRALASASARLDRLHRSGAVPRDRAVGSALLWLAVLEPTARAHRLLQALELDPERMRSTVLSGLVPAGAPEPVWPEADTPVGLLSRLAQGVIGRLAGAR